MASSWVAFSGGSRVPDSNLHRTAMFAAMEVRIPGLETLNAAAAVLTVRLIGVRLNAYHMLLGCNVGHPLIDITITKCAPRVRFGSGSFFFALLLLRLG